MHTDLLLALTGVIVLGIGAQWLAWRLRMASILLLLIVGFLAGPGSDWILGMRLLDPDLLMGDLLLPFVSLAVALILYEGGLTLRFAELREAGAMVVRLVTVGALVTWVLGAIAAGVILGLPVSLSILLGAILVVTGPTVVLPLLRDIRPAGRVGTILKWEGIVIDPIGAMLAVLVFEAIMLGDLSDVAAHSVFALVKTVAIGSALGFGAGVLLAILLRLFWIPDHLENAVSIMFVVAVYTVSDEAQAESGLFAATVMGITLANQRLVDVKHIVEFKENLRVLLISTLFILLAARLDMQDLAVLGGSSLLFLALLILLIRPASVLVARFGLPVTRGEFAFLSAMAPRGIVAAAVASVFSLRLVAENHPHAEALVPLTFMVIVGTVLFSSIAAPLVARRAGLAEANPQGVLFIGGQAWVRTVAAALKEQDIHVVIADTNRHNIAAARMLGIETYADSVLAEHALDDLNFGGIGRVLAVTPNDWVNVLAVQRFARLFGRSEVYQVAPAEAAKDDDDVHRHLHGRWLFDRKATFSSLAAHAARGATMRATGITEEFTLESYRAHHGERAVPMFVLRPSGALEVIVAEEEPDVGTGDTLISLVLENDDA